MIAGVVYVSVIDKEYDHEATKMAKCGNDKQKHWKRMDETKQDTAMEIGSKGCGVWMKSRRP